MSGLAAHPGQADSMQGGVGQPVAAAIEAMRLALPKDAGTLETPHRPPLRERDTSQAMDVAMVERVEHRAIGTARARIPVWSSAAVPAPTGVPAQRNTPLPTRLPHQRPRPSASPEKV
jgi:hypothetical protein